MTVYQCRYDLKRVRLPTPSENNCVRFSEDVRTIDVLTNAAEVFRITIL